MDRSAQMALRVYRTQSDFQPVHQASCPCLRSGPHSRSRLVTPFLCSLLQGRSEDPGQLPGPCRVAGRGFKLSQPSSQASLLLPSFLFRFSSHGLRSQAKWNRSCFSDSQLPPILHSLSAISQGGCGAGINRKQKVLL